MSERPAPSVTNPRSDRVKSVRALAGRSARARTGLFLAEGPQSVREAVRWARVRDLYLTPEAAARHPEVAEDAASRSIRTHGATPEAMAAMSPDAQGVLAVVHAEHPALAGVLARGPRLVAVLARVRDPGNAGTVIRAADALGADAVVLTEASVDPHNPKVVRSTAGSLFHLPVVTGGRPRDVVAALQEAGLAVLAADGAGQVDLDAALDAARGAGRDDGAGGGVDLRAPTAWLFGNEAWGLPEEDLAAVDAVVRIDIRGRAESLNLATAATLCLFASAHARR